MYENGDFDKSNDNITSKVLLELKNCAYIFRLMDNNEKVAEVCNLIAMIFMKKQQYNFASRYLFQSMNAHYDQANYERFEECAIKAKRYYELAVYTHKLAQ